MKLPALECCPVCMCFTDLKWAVDRDGAAVGCDCDETPIVRAPTLKQAAALWNQRSGILVRVGDVELPWRGAGEVRPPCETVVERAKS